MDLDNWPISQGRYFVKNKESPVAICTLFSLDLPEKLKDANVAIVGKVVTENIGIEKIIQNTIANPNIRFMIICGEEPKGHYVGQAIKCIIDKGVGEDGKIIDAMGSMPYLKNVTKEQIDIFRKQIKIIDMIGSEDAEQILKTVDECIKNNPGPFESGVETKRIETITAYHDEIKDVILDPKGFFTIFVNREKGNIVVEHYSAEWDNRKYDGDWKKCMTNHKLDRIFVGKNAEELAHTILREGFVSRIEHAAYLGRELQKAEQALKENKEYEQDKL